MDSPSDMFVVASDVIREWRATVDEDGQYRSAMMTESAARSNRQICDGLRFCSMPHARLSSRFRRSVLPRSMYMPGADLEMMP
jgi:hypothetical protein